MLFVQVLNRVGNSSELHEDTDDGEETELRMKMWLKPQGEIEEQIEGNTLAVWHKPHVSILVFLLALFGCSRIRVNTHVLVWIGVKTKFHSNPLQDTWIEVNPTTSKHGLN